MASLYFATDGNYGVADGIVLVDVSDWLDGDFEAVDDASDSDRAQVATLLDQFIKGGRVDSTLVDRLADLGVAPAVP